MNLWKLFFGKDLKEHFLSFDPGASHWRAITWNFDLKFPDEKSWVLEVHGKTIQLIEWRRRTADEVRFLRNSIAVGKQRAPKIEGELRALMNISIHSTIKHSLESNHEFMRAPVSGATTEDMLREAKALQWIQASFTTLQGALEKFNRDPNLILTAAFFSGKVPEENQESRDEVLRLIVFNLDISLYLRPDQSLHIIIFDDKNLGHGESKTPTFQQIIKVTKPQFYDEIVKLVHRLAQVGEIK